jgi:hypothetical protein
MMIPTHQADGQPASGTPLAFHAKTPSKQRNTKIAAAGKVRLDFARYINDIRIAPPDRRPKADLLLYCRRAAASPSLPRRSEAKAGRRVAESPCQSSPPRSGVPSGISRH